MIDETWGAGNGTRRDRRPGAIRGHRRDGSRGSNGHGSQGGNSRGGPATGGPVSGNPVLPEAGSQATGAEPQSYAGEPRRGFDEDEANGIRLAVRSILELVGEDPERDGLRETPERVARMYVELLEGYDQDLAAVVNGALFEVDYDEGEMVVVAGIEYASMCEHHLLPFTGQVHVAYMPRDRVVGLSKIPRIVDMFARRLQIQERLGNQIADAIQRVLDPRGVIVVVEGQHSCAALRGVKKQGLNMVTVARRGEFRTNPTMREEFLRLIGK